jgi:hypothetical protein
LPSFKVSSLVSQPLSSFDTTFEKGVFGTYDGIGPIPNEDVVITSSTNTTGLLFSQVSQPLTQLRRIGLQIKQQRLRFAESRSTRGCAESGFAAGCEAGLRPAG